MKNRVIIGVIIVLGGALIFENAYLLGRYNKERAYRAAYVRHRQMPAERFSGRALPVVYEVSAWDPFAEMNRMQERMERIFNDSVSKRPAAPGMFRDEISTGSGISFGSNGSAYTVKAHMPGIDKKDIKVQVKGKKLIISAKNRKDKTVEGEDAYTQESSYGAFLSRFILPEDAERSRIVSDYKDGILTITIPKKIKGK
ncbi:MAG: Hsp20/alpha crystallin family protein [Candidatus Omnitrophica bacterium]|nr:Hsp20/alpha crystallin family protein [Candidatus Omnitrophota bacterium]MDD5027861.1 Hsp20/alpha crystallin family protein [Candidatus Omnitrophota bacterium]MDD5662477.1 Hsp20/alpha crystallin family protein [Candidatus Omnitrophota bacterium]